MLIISLNTKTSITVLNVASSLTSDITERDVQGVTIHSKTFWMPTEVLSKIMSDYVYRTAKSRDGRSIRKTGKRGIVTDSSITIP